MSARRLGLIANDTKPRARELVLELSREFARIAAPSRSRAARPR
jgi:hypothetical protein